MKETTRRFRGSAWRGRCSAAIGRWAWQGEKATRLVHGVAKMLQIAAARDQVEKIAMLAGGGVGPFAGSARTVISTPQTYIEAAARRVHRVAGDPVAARPAPVGEIMAAHGLGIAREAARQIGSGADHGASRDQAAARAWARRSGWRSRIAARIAGPRSAAVGTKSRKRQAMISEVRPSALSCGTAPSEYPVSSTRCVLIHDKGAADLQPAGKIEHGPAIDDGAPGLVMRKAGRAVDAEGLMGASASGVIRRPMTRSPSSVSKR